MYESERFRQELRELIRVIWTASETCYEEYRSSSALIESLQMHGYRTEAGTAGIPTAFTAEYGSGLPVIGLLAEYDALDGLSQQADMTEPCPRPETTHGHGCGHHLIGAGIVGAALVLKDWVDAHPGTGTIRVIGCPAEEGGAAKTFMAREGVFDDLDIALTWHPSTINASMTGSMLANIMAVFRFHGKPSHAGAAPQKGRSALDAVELMNVGVNYLREHMEMTDRVHYAISNTGGVSPNVVQSEAEVIYLTRSRTNESAKALFERVVNIARGAALMTETTMDYSIRNALSNVVPSDTLGQLLYDKMNEVGLPCYDEEDRAYIARFRKMLGEEEGNRDAGLLPEFDMDERYRLCSTHPMGDFILPFEPKDVVVTASSDMGDVSRIAPLLQLQCACFCLGTQPHSWAQVAQGLSSYAEKGTLFAAQVLAEAVKTLLSDPALVEKAKAENVRRNEGNPYTCPIPPDVLPPCSAQKP